MVIIAHLVHYSIIPILEDEKGPKFAKTVFLFMFMSRNKVLNETTNEYLKGW